MIYGTKFKFSVIPSRPRWAETLMKTLKISDHFSYPFSTPLNLKGFPKQTSALINRKQLKLPTCDFARLISRTYVYERWIMKLCKLHLIKAALRRAHNDLNSRGDDLMITGGNAIWTGSELQIKLETGIDLKNIYF